MEQSFVFTEPHLERIHKETHQVIAELKEFENLSYQQLNWKVAPTSWSVIECIDHLKVTEELYIVNIQKSFDDARIRSLRVQKPFKSSWFGKMFANEMKPNKGRKIKNPRLFAPETGTLDTNILAEYIQMKVDFLKLLEDLNGYDIQKMKVTLQ